MKSIDGKLLLHCAHCGVETGGASCCFSCLLKMSSKARKLFPEVLLEDSVQMKIHSGKKRLVPYHKTTCGLISVPKGERVSYHTWDDEPKINCQKCLNKLNSRGRKR